MRRPVEADVFDIYKVLSDKEVGRWLSFIPQPYTLEDALNFMAHIVPREWVWALTLPGSSILIGAVSLMPKAGYRAAELGFWLSRDHWGRGLMTEAVQLVVTYGFDNLRLSFITSGYFEGNLASARVLEKLGFVQTLRGMRPGPLGASDLPGSSMILHAPGRKPDSRP